MTIAIGCLFIAGILPYITIVIGKWGHADYDNNDPRAWLAKQTGLAHRADAAHRNHFEAFPFFAAAIVIAHYVGVAQTSINGLAIAFVASRIVYTVCYLKNWAAQRSLVWGVGLSIVIALFVLTFLKT